MIVGSLVSLNWRAGLVLAGYLTAFGPWMICSSRTIFTFYAVVISPFVVLAVTYTLGVMMGQWHICGDKNWVSRYNLMPRSFPVNQVQVYLGLFIVALIFLVAVCFFPIWTGTTIPQHQFYWRMRLSSWT